MIILTHTFGSFSLFHCFIVVCPNVGLVRDPSFRSVRTMIKAPPDYEGKSFRIKPTPPSPVPSAGSWSNRSDKDSGLHKSGSENSLLRRLFHQDNDPTPTPTPTPVPMSTPPAKTPSPTGPSLSTPNWASKDMALIMFDPASDEGLNQQGLNISGKDSVSSVSTLRRNSHVSDRRRSSLISLMSRKDLLDDDFEEHISGKDNDSVSGLRRNNHVSEKQHSSLISLMLSLDDDVEEQDHNPKMSPLSNSRSPRHIAHSLKQSWKEEMPYGRPLNYQQNSSRHGKNDLSMSGKSMVSLGITDLLQAETGTSAITFDVDVAISRLFLRIKTKGTKKEDKSGGVGVGMELPSDMVEVSLLKEAFPSVWDDFYPGDDDDDDDDDDDSTYLS